MMRIEDMPPEERYSSIRLRALINQAVKKPWLREIFAGFLHKIEKLEKKRTFRIILFVNGESKDSMDRLVVPKLGETIVLDCGKLVRVVRVNHQWDDADYVQIDTEKVET